MSRPRLVEWIGCGRGEEEGRPALLGEMVASREDNSSQHDISRHILQARGAAGERRQTTTWEVRDKVIRLYQSIKIQLGRMTLHFGDLRGVAAHMAGAAR
jgi:hypothetical protein